MTKKKQQPTEPQTWRGKPLYTAPDGKFSTIDKDRFDAYMVAHFSPPKPHPLRSTRQESPVPEPDQSDESPKE